MEKKPKNILLVLDSIVTQRRFLDLVKICWLNFMPPSTLAPNTVDLICHILELFPNRGVWDFIVIAPSYNKKQESVKPKHILLLFVIFTYYMTKIFFINWVTLMTGFYSGNDQKIKEKSMWHLKRRPNVFHPRSRKRHVCFLRAESRMCHWGHCGDLGLSGQNVVWGLPVPSPVTKVKVNSYI